MKLLGPHSKMAKAHMAVIPKERVLRFVAQTGMSMARVATETRIWTFPKMNDRECFDSSARHTLDYHSAAMPAPVSVVLRQATRCHQDSLCLQSCMMSLGRIAQSLCHEENDAILYPVTKPPVHDLTLKARI